MVKTVQHFKFSDQSGGVGLELFTWDLVLETMDIPCVKCVLGESRHSCFTRPRKRQKTTENEWGLSTGVLDPIVGYSSQIPR